MVNRTQFQKQLLRRGFSSYNQKDKPRVWKSEIPPTSNNQNLDGKQSLNDQQRLKELIHKSEHVLFQATTVWPFDFFPDIFTIDENKVSLTTRSFWKTGTTRSYMLEDIKDVTFTKAIFLSTLIIRIERYTEDATELKVKPLWVKDAEEAQKILLGLLVALRQGVELEKAKEQKLPKQVEHIGEVNK